MGEIPQSPLLQLHLINICLCACKREKDLIKGSAGVVMLRGHSCFEDNAYSFPIKMQKKEEKKEQRSAVIAARRLITDGHIAFLSEVIQLPQVLQPVSKSLAVSVWAS